jgi:hypothetical protein
VKYSLKFGGSLQYLSITVNNTPWSRVIIEKLTGSQLVEKFPAFYGTRRFITAFTEPATCPYPEAGNSSPYPHMLLPEDQLIM